MPTQDFDQLVRVITDLVMARLKATAAARTPMLTVLWPAPTSAKEAILAGVATFRAEGRRVRWLVREDLRGELAPRLPEEERPRCHALGQAPVQAILSDMGAGDAVFVAAAHFDAARHLLALDDGLDWVHVLLQAHLSGQPVLICDDLLSTRGAAAHDPVAQEARNLARRLGQAGFRLSPSREISGLLMELTRSSDIGLQDAPGLITEQDVENLVRAGHRKLNLHARTLVTPLAESRAAELGLELLRPRE